MQKYHIAQWLAVLNGRAIVWASFFFTFKLRTYRFVLSFVHVFPFLRCFVLFFFRFCCCLNAVLDVLWSVCNNEYWPHNRAGRNRHRTLKKKKRKRHSKEVTFLRCTTWLSNNRICNTKNGVHCAHIMLTAKAEGKRIMHFINSPDVVRLQHGLRATNSRKKMFVSTIFCRLCLCEPSCDAARRCIPERRITTRTFGVYYDDFAFFHKPMFHVIRTCIVQSNAI